MDNDIAKANSKLIVSKGRVISASIICGLAVFLVVFTFFDLRISNYLFDSESVFGRIFKEIGETPMFLIVPFFVCSATFVCKNKPAKIVFTGILPFSNYFWLSKFLGLFAFSSDIVYYLVMLLLAVCFSLFLLWFFKSIQLETKQKLFRVFLIGIVFALLSLITVHFLKIIWGRVRFVNLDNNFSRWYIINGNTGNKSFPSGHTSAACGLFLLLSLCKEFHFKLGTKIILIGFMIAFIFSTALSRIILGAHYATDVTFATLLCYVLFLLSNHFVNKIYVVHPLGDQ